MFQLVISKIRATEAKKPLLAGIIYGLIAQLCFNTANYISRSLSRKYSQYQVMFLFSLQICMYNVFLSRYNNQQIKINDPYVSKIVLMRIMCVFIGCCFFFTALPMISYSEAMVINNMIPVNTGLLAIFLLNEKYTMRIFLTTFVSLVGVVLVAKPSFLFTKPVDEDFPYRNLAIVILCTSSLIFATAIILFRKVAHRIHINVMAVHLGICLAIGSGFMQLLSFSSSMEPREYLISIANGILETLGQLSFGRAIFLGNANYISLTGYMRIVYGYLTEYIFENRVQDPLSTLGAFLVFCSIFINVYFINKGE